jgi:Kef-type K+ transport system membrane component KefB
MMRIPGFQEAIFPSASMPGLSLVANLGLIMFLFLVGLEVNMRMFMSNWRVALSVGLAGMILPFGLGCAIAWGLYHEFRNDPGTIPISFGVYMLFIGTALAVSILTTTPPRERTISADGWCRLRRSPSCVVS